MNVIDGALNYYHTLFINKRVIINIFFYYNDLILLIYFIYVKRKSLLFKAQKAEPGGGIEPCAYENVNAH